MSLPFDQQVTLSPENLSPKFLDGRVVSTFRSRSDTESEKPKSQLGGWGLSLPCAHMRCYLLTIQFGKERIAVRSLLYIHNSHKPKFQFWMGVVSPFWSGSDTKSKKHKSQPWTGWGCLHLGGEHLLQLSWSLYKNYHYTLVMPLHAKFGHERIAVRSFLYLHNTQKSKFQLWVGGCLCPQSKKPKSQFWMGVVSTFWSGSDTNSKKP